MNSASLYHPRHWPTWLAAGILRLLALLPHPLLLAVGRTLGRIARPLARWRAGIAATNLQLCFSELDATARQRLLREHFEALGMGMMEFAMAWWWSDARLERLLLAVEGEEHLPDPDDPRGTIFLTGHFTSLELGGRYLHRRSPTYAMYRPNENPVLQALFERYRGGRIAGIISRNDARTMIKVLKGGDSVWFAPDQNFGRKGRVFADFMGVPAASNTATSRFAELTKARVIPFVLLRERGGYRLVIEPALPDFPSDDPQADTQRINDQIGAWVRRAPAQYNWIHRRFRHRPEGKPHRY